MNKNLKIAAWTVALATGVAVLYVARTNASYAEDRGVDLKTAALEQMANYNVGDVAPISQALADQCHYRLELDDRGNIAYDIVGIKGHGVVAIDVTPWRAYEHIERLEHICKIVLASGKNSK